MGKIKNIVFLVSLFLAFNISNSQVTIKGKIVFSNKENVTTANITLKNNNTIIAYNISDSDGNYQLKTNKSGTFQLFFSALNFENQTIDIEIDNTTSTIEKNIFLNYKPLELKEVIISNQKAITVKKDTIVFLAKSFAQGNEQVVEDLLKKIPGLNIDSNGTIKVGNQEVEKVMVDGDDMLEKGYKLLTKNMPVNPIETVELHQNYSNNKHLKGIENSNKVALNLTLKEDSKSVWFGNLEFGYGLFSENRYHSRSNLMKFGKKNKFYFLSNINNIGFNAIGDIDNLIRPSRVSEPGSIGDNQSANKLLRLNFDVPNLNQKRINFNNAEMISLNSIFTISSKIKIKTLGFLNLDQNNNYKTSQESFSLNDVIFNNQEVFVGRKKQITGFGKVDVTYDISKNKTLEYISKYNITNEKNSSNLIFNTNFLNESLENENQLVDQKLVFTNKISENKVILISGRYINEKTPQNYAVNQYIFDDLFSDDANNTKQFSQNKIDFFGLETHYLNKKQNGDLFEIKIGNQSRIDHLQTQFKLLDNQNVVASPIDYQNNLSLSSHDFYLSTKYRFKFGNYTLSTQSDFHKLYNNLQNFDNEITQNPFFIIPKIGLEWKINNKNKITTSFSHNTTNASVLDLYSGYVQTNFRAFSKGLNQFNQLNSSHAVLNYSFGNWGDSFFANTFILFSNSNDFFSTNSNVTQNYSLSEKIIIKDRNFLSISSSVDRFFKPIKSNFKVNFSATKTNFKNIINNSNLREVTNLGLEYGFELRSGFKGFFNYHIGTKSNYNQVTTETRNSFTNNMSFLDLSFNFSNNFNVQMQSERYYFGNLEKSSNKYYFLDIESRYTLSKNKFIVSISGNNLFNTKTFKNYTISDVYISKTEHRLLPRFVLLKMEYKF